MTSVSSDKKPTLEQTFAIRPLTKEERAEKCDKIYRHLAPFGVWQTEEGFRMLQLMNDYRDNAVPCKLRLINPKTQNQESLELSLYQKMPVNRQVKRQLEKSAPGQYTFVRETAVPVDRSGKSAPPNKLPTAATAGRYTDEHGHVFENDPRTGLPRRADVSRDVTVVDVSSSTTEEQRQRASVDAMKSIREHTSKISNARQDLELVSLMYMLGNFVTEGVLRSRRFDTSFGSVVPHLNLDTAGHLEILLAVEIL